MISQLFSQYYFLVLQMICSFWCISITHHQASEIKQTKLPGQFGKHSHVFLDFQTVARKSIKSAFKFALKTTYEAVRCYLHAISVNSVTGIATVRVKHSFVDKQMHNVTWNFYHTETKFELEHNSVGILCQKSNIQFSDTYNCHSLPVNLYMIFFIWSTVKTFRLGNSRSSSSTPKSTIGQ